MEKLIVNRLRANVTRIAGVFFYPSLNVIEGKEEIERITKTAGFKQQIEAGVMEIVEQEEEDLTGNVLVDSVASVSVSKAKDFIGDSISISDLEAVIDSDTRKGVISACKEQIEALQEDESDSLVDDGKVEDTTGFIEGIVE